MKKKLVIIAIWILLWQLLSLLVDNQILMVGPGDTLGAAFRLFREREFRITVLTSLGRILSGILIGTTIGFVLAYTAGKKSLVRDFLEPFVTFMKAVPVVSFVIILLVWVGSEVTPVYVTAFVTFPIAYLNMLDGFCNLDPSLSEMADVYHMTALRRFRYVELPQLIPGITAALSLAVGMGFKSGVAAEVIGQARHTIGNAMYRSKIYLETADLFAWTAVMILLSGGIEFLLRLLLPVGGNKEKKNAQIRPSFSDGKAVRKRHPSDTFRTESREAHVMLTGASGSGKTTKVREIYRETEDAIVLFQEDRLLPDLSAVENCRVVQSRKSHVTEEDIRRELKRILPPDTLDRPVSTLSGGEKRRVALVRSMLKDASVLLLDEPFSGLDQETGEMVRGYIREKSEGRTVYVTDHEGTAFPDWTSIPCATEKDKEEVLS